MDSLQESKISRFRKTLARHWNPRPIPSPSVDPELKYLTGLQRSAEVIRYSILSIEWWLSPNGTLREWCKLNGKIGSVLLIPAVLVVPLVTFILWQIAMWMGFLVGIAGNLVVFPLVALLATAVIAGILALFRAIFGR